MTYQQPVLSDFLVHAWNNSFSEYGCFVALAASFLQTFQQLIPREVRMFVCSHKFSIKVIFIVGAHRQVHVFIAGSSNLQQTYPYRLVHLPTSYFTTLTFMSIPPQNILCYHTYLHEHSTPKQTNRNTHTHIQNHAIKTHTERQSASRSHSWFVPTVDATAAPGSSPQTTHWHSTGPYTLRPKPFCLTPVP